MEAMNQSLYEEKFLQKKETGLMIFVKEGCPICQELHPLIEEIEEEYPDPAFKFYYVDAVAEVDFYKSFKLQGTPTVLFFRNGEQINKFTGMREYEEIEFLIDRTLAGK